MNENIPEFRFNNFTSTPKKYGLSEIVERVKSYSLSRDVETKEYTGYKYIHYGDIHKKVANIIDQRSQLPNIKTGDYELLKKGDIVIADASEDYQGIAIPSMINVETSYKIVAGLHTIALRPIQADSLFIYYLFNSQTFRKYGYKVGTGMKVFGISISNVMKFESFFPNTNEQSKIGVFFKQLDETIILQQQLLNDHKQLKKAMLQKMFPQKGETFPKVRFTGYTDDWEQRKFFENIQNTIDCRGKTPKKLGMNWSNSGYLALSALNVKNGYIDPSVDAHYGNKELYKKWMGGRELQKGQVLFTTEAPMGNVAQVPDDKGYILSQRTIAFDVNSEKMTDVFLAILLRSPTVFNDLSALSSGGTAKGVSQKSLLGLKVVVPTTVYEQKKIGLFFQQLDDTIALHQKKLETYQELKKAMLQKMFV